MTMDMKKSVLIAVALLALGACQSAREIEEGQRTNWRCAGDKEFSVRSVSYGVEVFAAGQTHRLDPVAGASGQYSNGTVTYSETGSLTGIGDPFENCQRRRGDWWFDVW
jgi:hypothetical protein